jgi:hypothetical protein
VGPFGVVEGPGGARRGRRSSKKNSRLSVNWGLEVTPTWSSGMKVMVDHGTGLSSQVCVVSFPNRRSATAL